MLAPGDASRLAIHQGRQERDQMDAAVVPQVPRQRRPAPASRPGLQSRQLHADTGFAEGGGALVLDDATGEAGQDWRQGSEPRPACHFPTGGGCGAEGAVPKNPPPHRWAATGLSTAMTALDPVASRSPDRTGVCRESRGALSAPGPVSGSGFRSPNRPDKGPNPTYRAGSRRKVWSERPSCYYRRQLRGAIWGISIYWGHDHGSN